MTVSLSTLVAVMTSNSSAIQGGKWNPMFGWIICRRDILYGIQSRYFRRIKCFENLL